METSITKPRGGIRAASALYRMTVQCNIAVCLIAAFLLGGPASSFSYAGHTGKVQGTVKDEKGEPIIGAIVSLVSTNHGAVTDSNGFYQMIGVLMGAYTVKADAVDFETSVKPDIIVNADERVIVDFVLAAQSTSVIEDLPTKTIYGQRGDERVTHTTATISTLQPEQIKLLGGSTQAPKLLQGLPGVDLVQNGIFDFNINVRGFNSSLNRRLLVLLDGRDLAIAFLGAQEWNGLSVPVEDLGKVELVRGPESALYGANAFNGVINILTPSPNDILGTKLTLGGGDLSSFRTDLREAWASGAWSYKVNVGRLQGDSWAVSRTSLPLEYSALSPFFNKEVWPLSTSPISSTYGSARADYNFEGGATSTIEAGATDVRNETIVTGIGRVQVPDALKPWAQASYSSESFYAQVYGAARNSQTPQISLSTGLPLDEHSFISQAEAQYRHQVFDERFFLIAGASIRYQTINTNGTLMMGPHDDNSEAAYSQLEYQATSTVKLIGAARWDKSTLHASQFSPKAAVVWKFAPDHSLRFSVNQAFESPALNNLFLHVTQDQPAHLAFIGNPSLDVEKITGYEIGYQGVYANSVFLTLDGYYNTLKNFISDLDPGVNPRYPGFGTYVLPGDSVARTIYSYTNGGSVNEFGFEAGVNYYVTDEWIIDANYARFDTSGVVEPAYDSLFANTPQNKINGGITYKSRQNYTLNLSVRYVPEYRWKSGIFRGEIYSYTTLNFAGQYQATKMIGLGLNVDNLFDNVHYEIVGGSLLH